MRPIFRRSLFKQCIDLDPIHGQAQLRRITGHYAHSWSHYAHSWSQKSPEVPLQVLNRYSCTRSAHISTMAQESKLVAPDNKTSRNKSWSQSSSTKLRQDDKSNSHRPSDRWATAPLRRTDHVVRNTTRRSFQPARFPQSGEHTTRHQGQRWPAIFRPYAETERVHVKGYRKTMVVKLIGRPLTINVSNLLSRMLCRLKGWTRSQYSRFSRKELGPGQ